jgi:hypothetical protein
MRSASSSPMRLAGPGRPQGQAALSREVALWVALQANSRQTASGCCPRRRVAFRPCASAFRRRSARALSLASAAFSLSRLPLKIPAKSFRLRSCAWLAADLVPISAAPDSLYRPAQSPALVGFDGFVPADGWGLLRRRKTLLRDRRKSESSSVPNALFRESVSSSRLLRTRHLTSARDPGTTCEHAGCLSKTSNQGRRS